MNGMAFYERHPTMENGREVRSQTVATGLALLMS